MIRSTQNVLIMAAVTYCCAWCSDILIGISSSTTTTTTSVVAFSSSKIQSSSRRFKSSISSYDLVTLNKQKSNQQSYRYAITTSLLSTSQDNEEQQQENDNEKGSVPVIPIQSSSTSTQPVQRKTLDPLFVALTKVDPQIAIQQQDMKSISLPIVGLVTLDRSLFLFVPLLLFAIGGIGLSLFILVTSSDKFVTALVETAQQQSGGNTYLPAAGSNIPIDSDVCRGLCSSQTQDIDGLRAFMNRISGK